MYQTSSEPAVPGHNAALHDAVRPAWSRELLSWLLGSPGPNDRLQVLDLGAGTGLGTRTIAALGHEVTAVDTADDMLTVLIKARQNLPPEVAKRIATATGSAEHIPLKDRSVDAITCLQAWHWMDPVIAMPECDRVLKPNGTLGLAWHTWDRANEWVKALADIVEPDGPPADQTQSVPADFAGRGAFERNEFPFDYELTATRLVQLAASWTFVSQRSDSSSVLSKIHHLSEQAAASSTGLVRFPHITAAFRLRGQKVD